MPVTSELMMDFMGRVIAGKASGMAPGSLHKVTVDGRDIMVVNLDGTYHAVDDTCTHAGSSLSEGTLDGTSVVCGWHGAEFDCTTGKLAKFPVAVKDLQQYKVTVESGNVFVEV